MFKIIATSNYDLETYAEKLIADNISNEELGKKMADSINAKNYEETDTYYRLVPADHVLWRGMEELV